MRNNEKYKTALEREVAFNKFCTHNKNCKSCECGPFRHTIDCKFSWLDLEAEEERPLPCPFCGGEVEVKHCISGIVMCCKCGYFSSFQATESSAIAAHNRVAKKCMEVKA